MIKINLLTQSRRRVAPKATMMSAQKMTIACGFILLMAGSFIGWRYWLLSKASNKIDADIAAAQQETTRLHSIISQVQQFEQRRAQLQQRVALIEQLRKDQTGPVHVLDEISRALPPLLWLSEVKQTEIANEVLIEGRGMTVTALPDFVANLEGSGYFKKSVDIISSQTEPPSATSSGVIKFVIKAQFQPRTGG